MFQVLYLDCDGCLSDFYSSALKALGKDKEVIERTLLPGTWSMEPACGVTEDEFWDIINNTPNFWESLDVLPNARGLVKVCEKYFGEEILLLTSPSKNPQSYAGKAVWVQKHFPKYARRLMVGPKKHMLAHSNAVLVDDYEVNCSKFEERGGKTVLVPNRGNKLHDKMDRVLEVVEEGLIKAKESMELAYY